MDEKGATAQPALPLADDANKPDDKPDDKSVRSSQQPACVPAV